MRRRRLADNWWEMLVQPHHHVMQHQFRDRAVSIHKELCAHAEKAPQDFSAAFTRLLRRVDEQVERIVRESILISELAVRQVCCRNASFSPFCIGVGRES